MFVGVLPKATVGLTIAKAYIAYWVGSTLYRWVFLTEAFRIENRGSRNRDRDLKSLSASLITAHPVAPPLAHTSCCMPRPTARLEAHRTSIPCHDLSQDSRLTGPAHLVSLCLLLFKLLSLNPFHLSLLPVILLLKFSPCWKKNIRKGAYYHHIHATFQSLW